MGPDANPDNNIKAQKIIAMNGITVPAKIAKNFTKNSFPNR